MFLVFLLQDSITLGMIGKCVVFVHYDTQLIFLAITLDEIIWIDQVVLGKSKGKANDQTGR